MLTRRLTAVLVIAVLALFIPRISLALGDSKNTAVNRYEFAEVVNTGLDNGYTGSDSVKKDDPHYAWSLGKFVISGFTSRTEGNTPVFRKSVGDRIKLSFVLEQNIDKLNGNESLVISKDINGYDQYFGIEQTDFGRGALLIRHTDYQNAKGQPQIYKDYLKGVKVGAETKVDVFEEGDYEVALDYEIKSPGLIPPVWVIGNIDQVYEYRNYRIFFRFKVRNSNAMVFLMDTETKSELHNGSVTPNGFSIDTAGSHYLEINVRKEVMNNTRDGLVEDTRFNRSASDGDEFTDEGIYTVTVQNPSAKENPTEKRIYVGDDDVLKASVVNGMDVSEVNARVEAGATIEEDGTLVTLPYTSDTYVDQRSESQQSSKSPEEDKTSNEDEKQLKETASGNYASMAEDEDAKEEHSSRQTSIQSRNTNSKAGDA